MVLNYQRWTPLCGCSFEQEVDSETGEIKLLFAHSICGGHEDIAKNTPEPKSLLKDNRKENIIKAKHEAWQRNKQKNLDDFENHDDIKRIKKRLNVQMRNAQPDPDTLKLNQYYLEHKERSMHMVDKFTNDKSIEMLIGLECPYSLNAHKVYEQILKEKQTTTEG